MKKRIVFYFESTQHAGAIVGSFPFLLDGKPDANDKHFTVYPKSIFDLYVKNHGQEFQFENLNTVLPVKDIPEDKILFYGWSYNIGSIVTQKTIN